MHFNPRYTVIRNILITVFALNIFVALAKGIYGYLTNSVSMLADGFHSLFDGTSNIIGLIGIYIASRPADPNHPYGHTKYETFASLAIGTLLFITAVQILLSSYRRLFTGVAPEVTEISFIIMLTTIAVNFAVTTFESRRGRQLKSELLISDSLHTRSDIFVSLSVIGSLIAVRLGYPIVDVIVALIIAVIIGYMGFSIFRESSDVLCDACAIEREQIRSVVAMVNGVWDSHAIRTRGRKNEIYLDLHILVDPKISVNRAHKIADEVELEVKKFYPEVADVLVHVEPYGVHG
ncbi:MAG: cation transporter [Actinobacteria bacterium]|nr:cation transporter [Actinomycetota bacterium]